MSANNSHTIELKKKVIINPLYIVAKIFKV